MSDRINRNNGYPSSLPNLDLAQGWNINLQDLFWELRAALDLYALIGGSSDLTDFMEGSFQVYQMQQWMYAWVRGYSGITKKSVRRKFRRKIWG